MDRYHRMGVAMLIVAIVCFAFVMHRGSDLPKHTGAKLLKAGWTLRFTPVSAAAAPEAGASAQGGGGIVSQIMPRPPSSFSRRGAAGGGKGPGPGARKQVWVLQDGQPQAMAVQVGISDGRMTEVSSEQLQPGMAVITDQRSSGARP